MSDVKAASDYYSENYGDYDLQNSPGKLAFYLELLERHVPAGSKIFELGVGQGNFLLAAASRYRVSGCDVNSFGVAQARLKVPGAEIFEGSVERVPENAEMSAIVSFDVLEHLPELPAALRELYKKLPPGGFLVGVVPVYDGPLGPLVRLLDNDPTHLTKVSRGTWLSLLRAAGFQISEYGGVLRKLFGRNYVHLTKPQSILRFSGVALYFVAHKPR